MPETSPKKALLGVPKKELVGPDLKYYLTTPTREDAVEVADFRRKAKNFKSANRSKQRAYVYRALDFIQDKSEFFRGYSYADLLFLADYFQLEEYKGLEVICRKGQYGESIGLVLCGELEVLVNGNRVRRYHPVMLST